MSSAAPALRAALTLLHLPSQAALIRAGPLPEGLLVLLRITAGDSELINQASTSHGASRELVCEAASFFLEQVLLHPDADSYRVLGASSEASYSELRRNMTLLLQWLHPDIDRRDGRSVFAARVTRAWDDLKTPERRAAYDRAQSLASNQKLSRATKKSHKKPLTLHQHHSIKRGFLRQLLVWLFRRSPKYRVNARP
jgi:hypothetical protein